MKNRLVKYIGLPSLVLVFILSTAYIFRTDPVMMISGKHLSGEEFTYPENWLFTNEYQTIKLETNPRNPHSVTTVCFIRDGKLIIPSQEGHTKKWTQYVLEDNRVRIKVGNNIYSVRLSLIEKDANIKEIGQYLAIKFPNRTPPKPDEGPKNIWLFEVSPRQNTSSK